MAWQTLTEYNLTGPEGLFVYPATAWVGFTPLLLFSLFCIVALSTFFIQKRFTGRGDFLGSITAASWFGLVISYVMSLIPGLVGSTPIIIFLIMTIVSTLILLLNTKTKKMR